MKRHAEWSTFTGVGSVQRKYLDSVKHNHPNKTIYPFQRGHRLYTSESDVCRRQILTYKDGPCTERIKNMIMAVDPSHRYSSEAERAN